MFNYVKPFTKGKARSSISMHTPSRTSIVEGSSIRCKMTSC